MKAEAKFQKKTQHHQVRPTFAPPGARQAAVLNSLNSVEAKRGYGYAIDEFVFDWYCSEPRFGVQQNSGLAVSLASRIRQLAPGTTNLRLGACVGCLRGGRLWSSQR